MDRDESVRQLYEEFPYPRPLGSLDKLASGEHAAAWNLRSCAAIHFPDRPIPAAPAVLVAGCGTNMAPVMAATLPQAHIVGIDVSEASLAISAGHIEKQGLSNVELHHLPIERVEELDRDFDYIHCHGVLHHLHDPVVGLRKLGNVCRPGGVLSLMVYATYGRTGLYMLQDLCARLHMGVNERDGLRARDLLRILPPGHPFKNISAHLPSDVGLEEVMDMILHPRDVSYTTDGVRALVDDAGMHFQRWLPAAQYDPNYTTMAKAELHESLAGLDSWQQAAATELFWGTIIKHEFLVTPVPHPSHEELFGEERILEAIVSLAGHLVVEHEGETLKLRNLHHAVPIEVTASLRDLLPLLKAIDDKRNVAEVLTIFLDGTPDDPQLILDSMSLIRSLVGADLLDLRRPDERSP
jgi:SAM-dependent methyltransferase